MTLTTPVGSDYGELSMMTLPLPNGLVMEDVVCFNITIINDEVVEEMFENFTVSLLSSSSRVSVTGTSATLVDIREDPTDSEYHEDMISHCTPSARESE